MKQHKLVAATLFALGSLSALPSLAGVILDVDVAPPEQRVEVVPAPRAGYAWTPGYWNWDGRQHVWTGGAWVQEQPGQRWVADRWDRRDGGHYHREPGHWERQ